MDQMTVRSKKKVKSLGIDLLLGFGKVFARETDITIR